jgi:hypothetical protein
VCTAHQEKDQQLVGNLDTSQHHGSLTH